MSKDFEITEVTEDNWKDYCSFPNYIIEKYNKGFISKIMFSDLIRINLLNNYGGTWIDSNVLCTGGVDSVYFMLNSDLFIPQSIYLETLATSYRIDNFFMTSCQNNKILLLAEKLLWLYWKNNNKLSIYLLTYEMLEFSKYTYQNEWTKNIPFSRSNFHLIEERLYDKFNLVNFEEFKRITPFHKLTYKKNEFKVFISKKDYGNSYYDYIIKNY